MTKCFSIPSGLYRTTCEDEMMALASACYHGWNGQKFIVYLQGDLGTGKTTFVRGFLRAAGFKEIVKSPTYTLIEYYERSNHHNFAHLDLYRLESINDHQALDVREVLTTHSCFIEWPDRMELNISDLIIDFRIEDNIHICEVGFMSLDG